LAVQHAQTEGLNAYVADIEAETLNARGGQISLDPIEQSPVKREESYDSSQRGDALALAA
jgi:hypothetical protein